MFDDDDFGLARPRFGRRRRDRLGARLAAAADQRDDHLIADARLFQLLQRRGVDVEHAAIDLDERQQDGIREARLRQLDEVAERDRFGVPRGERDGGDESKYGSAQHKRPPGNSRYSAMKVPRGWVVFGCGTAVGVAMAGLWRGQRLSPRHGGAPGKPLELPRIRGYVPC